MKKVLLTLTTALLLLPATAGARSRATTPATTTPAATTAATTTTTTTATTPAAPTKIVHVNSASAAELMTIPGISAQVANNVIKNRPYKDVNELIKKVKGIGPKNVKKMIPYIDFK